MQCFKLFNYVTANVTANLSANVSATHRQRLSAGWRTQDSGLGNGPSPFPFAIRYN
ncbi:hypothetical protein CBM2586_A11127 [Cupriavidus phytorum]|uniref:Uncharacterized protein n=1 Tax=Cupriavidus taiwanensis TaxID=164546 RepID=A0A375BD18_9BURK|nr:hypothetical protein CBM2586_A11127 [Cupriavidus taiwanensis]